MLFICGYYWIPVRYKNGCSRQSIYKSPRFPRVITPNHSTLFDGFMMLYLFGGVAVAKNDFQHLPIVGRVMGGAGTIWVDRSSAQSRKETVTKMLEYINDDTQPPILIFPQGTTSNTQTLTQFKVGAFLSKKPVLPIAIHHNNCLGDISLLSSSFAFDLIHGLCQFINFASVHILPVYTPNEEEVHDLTVYANGVRKVIAEDLKATITDHAFDDVMLRYFAKELMDEIGFEADNIVMSDITQELNFRAKTIIKLGKVFLQHCDADGKIDFDSFCKLFVVQNRAFVLSLFDLLTKARDENPDIASRFILFEEFLIGISICFDENRLEDCVTLFFSTSDSDNDGFICAKDVMKLIQFVNHFHRQTDEHIFENTSEMFVFCEQVFVIKDGSAVKLMQQSNDARGIVINNSGESVVQLSDKREYTTASTHITSTPKESAVEHKEKTHAEEDDEEEEVKEENAGMNEKTTYAAVMSDETETTSHGITTPTSTELRSQTETQSTQLVVDPDSEFVNNRLNVSEFQQNIWDSKQEKFVQSFLKFVILVRFQFAFDEKMNVVFTDRSSLA